MFTLPEGNVCSDSLIISMLRQLETSNQTHSASRTWKASAMLRSASCAHGTSQHSSDASIDSKIPTINHFWVGKKNPNFWPKSIIYELVLVFRTVHRFYSCRSGDDVDSIARRVLPLLKPGGLLNKRSGDPRSREHPDMANPNLQ